MLSKRFTKLVIITVYILFQYSAVAQQSVPVNDEQDQKSSNAIESSASSSRDNTDNSNGNVTIPKDAKPKTTVDAKFDPSEEISEDLSVPFPVDI